jgi:phosphotransferase system IIB component
MEKFGSGTNIPDLQHCFTTLKRVRHADRRYNFKQQKAGLNFYKKNGNLLKGQGSDYISAFYTISFC